MAHLRRQPRTLSLFIAFVSLFIMGRTAPGGADATAWTRVTNLAPDSAGTMLLLTDGTIMVQGYNPGNDWMRLTPDRTGSYINGTWSQLAPMSTPRLYYASHVLPSGKVWLLGGEYTGSPLRATWTNTGEIYDPLSDSWSPIAPHPEAQFGDDPSMLLSSDRILAGSLTSANTYLYDIDSDRWDFEASKVYKDRSDEESWVTLPGNKVLTYDLFHSVATGGAYAELYDPTTHIWSSISPSDGTALGMIPQLSATDMGFELGPILRLRGGGIFVIGATGHTARYRPSTNTWRAGPDVVGTLSGSPAPFGADDAPAALLPNGHVLFAADAGPAAVRTTGNTTIGSPLITDIPSTDQFQRGWGVSGTGVPTGSRIVSVDSDNQVRISQNATATNNAVPLRFGGTFSNPTQLFDFDPTADAISSVPPPSASLENLSAYVTRMLILPTGQVLFSDGSNALWVYTPGEAPPPGARPVIRHVKYEGHGLFTLKGRKLNGQSAGAAYGDDVEHDENYPIVRLTCDAEAQRTDDILCSSAAASVFYARTTNWSTADVATGAATETVNFTLQPGITAGRYLLEVVAAGISSVPWRIHITQAEIDGL